ncbi:MAG: aminotransferase class IV [Planctomycetes bacterium]|nr:aminotransferase class IV [Planctomycetota bacterium]
MTEGTTSNAFFVRGGALFTHPADHRILNGVTRDAVLELARQQGFRVRHQGVTLAEATASEEAFMTGTTTEIMPAVTIDGKPVGTGKPGQVTLKLRAAYRELTEKECG